MNTKLSMMVGTKLSFQMNDAFTCWTMMAVFGFDTMPVNTAFQSALSNDIVVEHPGLWSGARFRIMDDPICYEFK